jgi:hypothetical protein
VANPKSLTLSQGNYLKSAINTIYDTAVFDKVEIPATDVNEIKRLEDLINS